MIPDATMTKSVYSVNLGVPVTMRATRPSHSKKRNASPAAVDFFIVIAQNYTNLRRIENNSARFIV